VDLVFVEYVLNDGFLDGTANNGRVRVMERLLRSLLSRRRSPAVVLLQTPAHGQAFRRGHAEWKPFHITPEDQYGALALYYDTPWCGAEGWPGGPGRAAGGGHRQCALPQARSRHGAAWCTSPNRAASAGAPPPTSVPSAPPPPRLSLRQAFLNRLGSGEPPEAAAAGGMAYMSFDGLHPNDLGHKVGARRVSGSGRWEDALAPAPALQPAARSLPSQSPPPPTRVTHCRPPSRTPGHGRRRGVAGAVDGAEPRAAAAVGRGGRLPVAPRAARADAPG
jgi:hypothetical protein